VAGCSNDLDSLYEPVELPLLPSSPDHARVAACTACAQDSCESVRARCLEDDACTELLACRGACSNPTCAQRCVAAHGFSPWYDDFWACVLNDECAEACGSGENFACVDGYQAPRAEQDVDRFPVRFRFKNPRTGLAYAYPGDQRDEQFVVGASARSCPAQETADTRCQPTQTGVLDAMNSVQLDVVVDQYTRNFTGLIEIEHEPPSGVDRTLFQQGGTRDRYMPPFFAEPTEFRFYVFWRGWFREALDERPAGVPDFETAASVAVYLEDCMGAPARGVRIELPEASGVETLNQNSDGSLSLEATDTGSALVGDVPAGQRDRAIAVQAVRVEDATVVARRNDVYVRPGWITHVWLMPRPAR
jgi:hypothetical protein